MSSSSSVISSSSSASSHSGKRIVGYYCQWSVYAGHNYYTPAMVPYSKVTHINYAFAGSGAELVQLDNWADEGIGFGEAWDSPYKGNLGQFQKFKLQYPGVKFLISIGGWTRSDGFHAMALTSSGRQTFAASAVAWIRKYKMDGVDIDWEYPGVNRSADWSDPNDRGAPGGPEDYGNYTLLLRDLRLALDAAGAVDGKYYELTAAVGAGYDKIGLTAPGDYCQYLDAVNLMTYDFHGGFESAIGHQAPLYANPLEPYDANVKTKYNINWTVNEFLRLGVPASKIVVGLPFYSRGWNNVTPNAQMPGGMFGTGSGSLSGAWGIGGQGPYSDIEALRAAAGYTEYWDDTAKASYLYNPNLGVLYTYDNEQATSVKCDYINSKNLGGAMYWELDGDPNKKLVNLVYDKILGGGGSYSSMSSVSSSSSFSSSSSSSSSLSSVSSSSVSSSSSVASSSSASSALSSAGVKATGVPGAPQLSPSVWDESSSYSIIMDMWWGNNAVLYELYENGTRISSITLNDDSPNAQKVSVSISGKANGNYVYTAKLSNTFGSVVGNPLTVTVTKSGSSASSASSSTSSSSSSSSVSSSSSSVTSSSSSSSSSSTAFTNLPKHLLTGYWQNFNNGAQVLRISEVPVAYDIICVSFADATATPGAVVFNLDPSLGFSKAQFIADIAMVKARGQHVIISVGGQFGAITVNNAASASNFASSINALMTEYGFEGVDIDLENGVNPDYMAMALRMIKSNSIITMAPETIYMQNTNSAYFALCLKVKDILTVVNTQFYNSGSMLGQDGNVYSQGTVDFLTALAAIQLENGLRPDQVGLGVPSTPSGAGSGYVAPSVVNQALDCLTTGVNGGTYHPPRLYPSFRGAMCWSINWDASAGYPFANAVKPKLLSLP